MLCGNSPQTTASPRYGKLDSPYGKLDSPYGKLDSPPPPGPDSVRDTRTEGLGPTSVAVASPTVWPWTPAPLLHLQTGRTVPCVWLGGAATHNLPETPQGPVLTLPTGRSSPPALPALLAGVLGFCRHDPSLRTISLQRAGCMPRGPRRHSTELSSYSLTMTYEAGD